MIIAYINRYAEYADDGEHHKLLFFNENKDKVELKKTVDTKCTIWCFIHIEFYSTRGTKIATFKRNNLEDEDDLTFHICRRDKKTKFIKKFVGV